jgi:hypothetical protein
MRQYKKALDESIDAIEPHLARIQRITNELENVLDWIHDAWDSEVVQFERDTGPTGVAFFLIECIDNAIHDEMSLREEEEQCD